MHLVERIEYPFVRIIAHHSEHQSTPESPRTTTIINVFVHGTMKCWKLADGMRIRFRKHGTFEARWNRVHRAPYVVVTLPRKKWNPHGPSSFSIPFPVGHDDLRIARDAFCHQDLNMHERDWIISSIDRQDSLNPPGTKMPRW